MLLVVNICINFLFSADKVNPEWVKLNMSRGFESSEHKLFMRYTGKYSQLMYFC
jgi:alpha-1,3-glucosyltransferase